MTGVFCLGANDVQRLGEILDFYRRDGIDPPIYVAPMGFDKALGEALSDEGFVPVASSQTLLYGPSALSAPAAPPGVTVEAVTPQTLDVYTETTARGFE